MGLAGVGDKQAGNGNRMAGRIPKKSISDWIEAGQRMLVDEGIAGLKVDWLASRLGVSRGGF